MQLFEFDNATIVIKFGLQCFKFIDSEALCTVLNKLKPTTHASGLMSLQDN